jgi:uncharacterized membrane protein YedE/YeeE
LFSCLSGAAFTFGLALSGLTQPSKVRAFLDVTGDWDPSLALVMVGAIGVYALLFRWGLRRQQPWHASEFSLPARRRIDARLLAGAAVFGVGWGLAGVCPGPAWSALGTGSPRVIAFVFAMLCGMALVGRVEQVAAQRGSAAPARGAT